MNELKPAPIVLTATLITFALGIFNITYGKPLGDGANSKTLLSDLAPLDMKELKSPPTLLKKNKDRRIASLRTSNYRLPVERAPASPETSPKFKVEGACSGNNGVLYHSGHPHYANCLEEKADGRQTLGRLLIIRLGGR